jgi:hypothetical protein
MYPVGVSTIGGGLVPTPGTQRTAIRIEPDLWERFAEVAKPNRSAVLRDFIRWYVGDKGATMPRRRKSES